MTFNFAASLYQQQPQSWSPPDPPPTTPPPRVTPSGQWNTQPARRPVLLLPGYFPQDVPTSDGEAVRVIAGGTPVALVTGPINGGFVINPVTAAGQNVTMENVNIDLTGPCLAGDANGSGSTVTLTSVPPGNRFDLPRLAPGVTVWANAATSGHRLSVVVW